MFAVATAFGANIISSPSSPPERRTPARSVDGRIAAAAPVFRRAQRADDALSPAVAGQLAQASILGTNGLLSRRAATGPDGEPYFLVAGNNSVALVDQFGSGSVDDVDHMLSGRNVSFSDCARGGLYVKVVGFLPSSASNAAIIRADGSREALTVTDNVYVSLFRRTAETLPDRLEFDLAGDHVVVPIGVPSDLLQTRCAQPGDSPKPAR